MKLYEATNGWLGGSYTRAYVWAHDEAEALELARQRFKADENPLFKPEVRKSWNNVQLELLFEDTGEPFCTEVSDEGWAGKSEAV